MVPTKSEACGRHTVTGAVDVTEQAGEASRNPFGEPCVDVQEASERVFRTTDGR